VGGHLIPLKRKGLKQKKNPFTATEVEGDLVPLKGSSLLRIIGAAIFNSCGFTSPRF
jgi:hypothetical protein